MQKLEIENSFLNSSIETLFCLLCAAGNDKKAKKAMAKRVQLEKKKQSKNVLLEGDLEMMLTQPFIVFALSWEFRSEDRLNDEAIPLWTHVLFSRN